MCNNLIQFNVLDISMDSNTFKISRLKLGLSQRELADRMGMTKNSIQKIEASDSDVKTTNELSLRYIASVEFSIKLPGDKNSLCAVCNVNTISRDNLCESCIDKALFDFMEVNSGGEN